MIKIGPSEELIKELCEVLGLDSKKVRPGEAVTAGLNHALKQGLSPALTPPKYTDSKAANAFRVNPVTRTKLNAVLADQLQLDASQTLSSVTHGMLVAVVKAEGSKTKTASTKSTKQPWLEWLRATGLSSRPEQEKLIRDCEFQLASTENPIVMAEASVGVGKSYAMLCSGIVHAMNPKSDGAVIIAAPTYQIAKQLLESAKSLTNANAMRDIKISLIRSRAEFISKHLMSLHLTDESHSLETEVSDAARTLLSSGEYKREQYESIGIDCSRLTLSTAKDPSDPGENEYMDSRYNAADSDLVFCTHAMLAAHVSSTRSRVIKAKKIDKKKASNQTELNELIECGLNDDPKINELGLLPKCGLLIIDEAHKLEDTYRAIQSRKVSLGSLRRAIKDCAASKLLTKKNAIEACEVIDAFAELISTYSGSHYPSQKTMALMSALEPLVKFKTKKLSSKYALFVSDEMDSLRDIAMNSDRKHEFYASPVRNAISIQNTTRKPSSWLDMTWRISPKSLLVSGTLSAGGINSDYSLMAIKCNIPTERLKAVGPIETTWLRKNVTLHLPQPSENLKVAEIDCTNSMWLPPKEPNPSTMEKWCSQQAEYVSREISKTQGGSIVFCTSYDQIDLLSKSLDKLMSNNPEIIILKSVSGTGISAQVGRYIKAYRSGLQVVWVAIANAGTGVDMTDSELPADKDNMVQSIFITRIPNLTASKRDGAKTESVYNFLAMVRESISLTQQMIGRLVRRPGRNNMHIHMMDSRFNIKKGHYRMYSKLFDKYEIETLVKNVLIE